MACLMYRVMYRATIRYAKACFECGDTFTVLHKTLGQPQPIDLINRCYKKT